MGFFPQTHVSGALMFNRTLKKLVTGATAITV